MIIENIKFVAIKKSESHYSNSNESSVIIGDVPEQYGWSVRLIKNATLSFVDNGTIMVSGEEVGQFTHNNIFSYNEKKKDDDKTKYKTYPYQEIIMETIEEKERFLEEFYPLDSDFVKECDIYDYPKFSWWTHVKAWFDKEVWTIKNIPRKKVWAANGYFIRNKTNGSKVVIRVPVYKFTDSRNWKSKTDPVKECSTSKEIT